MALPNLAQLLESANIELTEDGLLTREGLIRLLDLRWSFNGATALHDLFYSKRLEALNKDDIELYKHYVSVFELAIEERLQLNYHLLTEVAPFTLEKAEMSQEVHFQNVADEEFVWILNVAEFLQAEIPEWLTIDAASTIYQEIGEITSKITESEQDRI